MATLINGVNRPVYSLIFGIRPSPDAFRIPLCKYRSTSSMNSSACLHENTFFRALRHKKMYELEMKIIHSLLEKNGNLESIVSFLSSLLIFIINQYLY